MSYKTELHCHSKDASGCSHESVEGICEKYLRYGYTTVCLTNHFTPEGNFLDPAEWAAKVRRKYAAYEKLKACANGRLTILMGLEFRFVQNSNDYLVFGFDEDWLVSHTGEMLRMGIRKFTEMARAAGLFTIQAHPFRHGMVVTDASCVDAVEIFNGHPGHNSNNDIAEAWARKYGKIMTSGTDHHNPDHMPDAGIRTDFPITSEAVLIETLRSGAFTLIRGEEDAKN